MVTMGPDGTTSFVQVGRRDLLLGGAAVLAGLGMGSRPARHRQAVTMPRNLTQYHQVLETLRELGQVAAPQSVLPMVAGHAHTLRMLAKETRGRDALDVAMLSARTAEFAGWMAQEAGDDGAAAWWAGRAVQVAAAAGDRHTAAYSQVRRALVTMYQGDAEATVEFARRAQADPGTHPRILGLAAQREAQGHALAGDHTACLRALDRAAHYLSVAGNSPSQGPVIGTSHVSDPVSVVTGWCLYDLGRPQEAAELLDREVLGIPATAVRMRTRFGVRQALAHSAAGDLDRACDLAQSMVQQASTLGSATILTDLARLATSLRRWNSHTAVRALEPAFGEALYRGAY
ncbi:MAG: transcriptional regulator [Labedaea sp.]